MNQNASSQLAIDFLNGTCVDGNGRVVEDYLNFDDADFEQCHDWVQWAFPTRTLSAFNPNAPLVSEDFAFEYYNPRHDVAKNNTANIAARYLHSMGFEVYKSIAKVTPPAYRIEPPTTTAALGWETPDNHNMLRFTRIIESLRIFGNDALAAEVYNALMQRVQTYTDRYSLSSVAYWSLAITA